MSHRFTSEGHLYPPSFRRNRGYQNGDFLVAEAGTFHLSTVSLTEPFLSPLRDESQDGQRTTGAEPRPLVCVCATVSLPVTGDIQRRKDCRDV